MGRSGKYLGFILDDELRCDEAAEEGALPEVGMFALVCNHLYGKKTIGC